MEGPARKTRDLIGAITVVQQAEELGLIALRGESVVRNARAQNTSWRKKGPLLLHVPVNRIAGQ